MEQTINFGGIVSAVIKVDNSSQEERQFDIQAQARINGQQVEAIENGQVTTGGKSVADFNSYQDGYLSINFQPGESRESLYQAIEAFIQSVRQSANQAAQAIAIVGQEEGGQA